jgi:hypothetical protein
LKKWPRFQSQAEALAHVVAHLERAKAKRVFAILLILFYIAAADERAEQTMDGGSRQHEDVT